MKGVVFTEFVDMVEQTVSVEIMDDIIAACPLPSAGAYTAVGTYDHQEFILLVQALSQRTQTAVPTLLKSFGQHLFHRFAQEYPEFFRNIQDAFTFLTQIDNTVHSEVLKLYPDAELPSFECQLSRQRHLIMIYRSSRPFTDLAEGLIRGCIAYFDEDISLQREDLSSGKTTTVKFCLIPNSKSTRSNVPGEHG